MTDIKVVLKEKAKTTVDTPIIDSINDKLEELDWEDDIKYFELSPADFEKFKTELVNSYTEGLVYYGYMPNPLKSALKSIADTIRKAMFESMDNLDEVTYNSVLIKKAV